MATIDERVLAIILGTIFSIVNAFIIVYLSLKTGMGMGMDMLFLLLSFFIFLLASRVRNRGFIYMTTMVSGSTGIVLSFIDGVGAIIISRYPFVIPDYLLVVLPFLAGLIGAILATYFKDYFLKMDYPWPQSKVNASLISIFSTEITSVKFKISAMRMCIASAASAMIAVLKNFMIIPGIIGSTNLGIGISPMYLGMGMLIGFRGCVELAAGAVVSLLIILFIEGTSVNYSAHMRSPWILSPMISILMTTAIISLYPVINGIIKSYRKNATRKDGVLTDGGEVRSVFSSSSLIDLKMILLIIAVLLASILLWLFVGVPVWVFFVGLTLSILFMIIETKSKAETAITIGISSFIIILILGLALNEIIPLLLLDGFIMAMTLSVVQALANFKTAKLCNVSLNGVVVMFIIGVCIGAIICIPSLKFFNGLYGIGTDALPAPYSVMWLEIAKTTVTKVISTSLDPYLLFIGVIAALVLNKYKISAVRISVGMILPVSMSMAILIGGLLSWFIKKKNYLKNDTDLISSGIIAGDVITSIILTFRSLL